VADDARAMVRVSAIISFSTLTPLVCERRDNKAYMPLITKRSSRKSKQNQGGPANQVHFENSHLRFCQNAEVAERGDLYSY